MTTETATTALDWRRHAIGPLRPCVHCGHPALCCDENNQPCHKVCAETANTHTNHLEGETQ